MPKPHSVMFIAGDPSGDHHAAAIIQKLSTLDPQLRMWGIGGPTMTSKGFSSVMPFAPFNKMGFVEVIRHLPFFLGAKKELISKIKSDRPDALVCVDYPGFNMIMLKEARKLGIPVIWYIAPMVWAWKRKRAEVLGNLASHIAVIFPFEESYFSQYKAPVTFVGNPLIEAMLSDQSMPVSKKQFPSGEIRLALIPGSRTQEIKHMLDPMLQTAEILQKEYPGIKVTISQFSGLDKSLFSSADSFTSFSRFKGPLRELLRNSDLALATSGTACLEAALMGIPTVIAYKTSTLTYSIFKHLIKIPYIGLPNIIADRSLLPECIQNEANPQNMAGKLREFLTPHRYEKTVSELNTLSRYLSDRSPSKQVAEIIYSYLGRS